MKYRIAEKVIEIKAEESWIHPFIKEFSCDETEQTQLYCELIQQNGRDTIGQMTLGEMVLLRSECMEVYEGASGIDLLYPHNQYISSVRITMDRCEARIYAVRKCNQDNEDALSECIQELYFVLRDILYFNLERDGKIAIRSSSVFYRSKGILFSTAARSGQSSFASLWEKMGLGIQLNGDVNLCGTENGKMILYGTPWCGTSGVFRKEKVELGAVIFMLKAPCNEILTLPADKQQLFLLARCVSPIWREELLDQCLDQVKRMETALWIRQMKFQLGPEAVEMIRGELDQIF